MKKFGMILAVLVLSLNSYASTKSEVLVVSIESGGTSPLDTDEDIDGRLSFDADYGICYTGNRHAAFRNSLSKRLENEKGFAGYRLVGRNIVLLGQPSGKILPCSDYESLNN